MGLVCGEARAQGAGLFLYPPRTLTGGAPCSCKKYWLLRQRQIEFTFLKRESKKILATRVPLNAKSGVEDSGKK